MGDHHDGAAAHGVIECLLHGRFRFGIECGCRLVEEQDRCVAHQRAGDRQRLALASGKRHPVFADGRVVSLRLRADEVMRIGQLRGLLDLGIRGCGAAIADIVADRAFKQVRLLRNIGEPVAQ